MADGQNNDETSQSVANECWSAFIEAVAEDKDLADIFQPDECANYFASCGYDPD